MKVSNLLKYLQKEMSVFVIFMVQWKVYQQLHKGVGTVVKHASAITDEEHLAIWNYW